MYHDARIVWQSRLLLGIKMTKVYFQFICYYSSHVPPTLYIPSTVHWNQSIFNLNQNEIETTLEEILETKDLVFNL
jgi:hypothetical protein